MVEIGLGLGVIIELVGCEVDKFIVIEFDCDLVECLCNYLELVSKLIIYEGDVMCFDFK